ncbi:pancreas/duodenum homeobox protein 1 [Desulfonema ishimotonii]|uniref:Pancreas/duodenum homeobox protein 1 n=1 Tax=Desulfonema ishimotonii TaxID=45657 RepID=A0A401FT46_9BACT|nr:pancreas/duodenum homeobox protein 1 [Desulfonema ishimotonii]GBC60139.1 pancreas/duodenum homeobox protein 1 [Desulfonema ishimotonii]
MTAYENVFTPEVLEKLFPADRADRFFDALLGDADDGAYDIKLVYKTNTPAELRFEFQLLQRPGKCLACNLTYGLPQVFSRHPVINVSGLVRDISQLMNGNGPCSGWRLGATREISRALHVVPLIVSTEPATA